MTPGTDDPAGLVADDHDDDAWPHAASGERLDHGGTYLLDLVAAVDHLGRGLRPDFTVWDALAEALDWWLTDRAPSRDGPDDDRDPLRSRLHQLLDGVPRADTPAPDAIQQALRRWTAAMADRYNAGYHWPHPTPRREFPPELLSR